jgi:hypothetical protein
MFRRLSRTAGLLVLIVAINAIAAEDLKDGGDYTPAG